MNSRLISLLLRIGLGLLLAMSVVAVPQFAMLGIMVTNASGETEAELGCELVQFVRRREAMPIAEQSSLPAKPLPRVTASVQSAEHSALESSGHLQAGHRLANGVMAPVLV